MKKSGIILLSVLLIVLAGCSKQKAETQAQTPPPTQSSEITVVDVTSLQDVLANPSEYLDKTILVEGEVTGRCMGSGCWISLKVGDDDRGIIVTTLDESYIFPTDCIDKTVQIQGALKVKNADEMEMKAKEVKGADHECPNPEYFFEPQALKVTA
ncbi:MAG: DUF4920 domain-containing protein [bacterium]